MSPIGGASRRTPRLHLTQIYPGVKLAPHEARVHDRELCGHVVPQLNCLEPPVHSFIHSCSWCARPHAWPPHWHPTSASPLPTPTPRELPWLLAACSRAATAECRICLARRLAAGAVAVAADAVGSPR
eukprot:scaffold8864_cov122-Isochrysis_galbana.AAC.1